MGGLVISSVITLVLTSLMIVGSQMESPLMLLPIIILKGVLILVTFVATWYLSIYAFVFSIGSFSFIIFAGNICGGIMLYVWLVICSRRVEIKNGSISSNCA
ncbi:GSCOCG00013649001-RA-CDS [Cotesia congregata]|nr:GSCOCG00013649001-RA-CDS [Cotesia congregata]